MHHALFILFALTLATVTASCTSLRRPPPGPLVGTLAHPVETMWSRNPSGEHEVRLSAEVGDNSGRDVPPTRSFPCITLEARAVGTPTAEWQSVACFRSSSPTTITAMTLAAERHLGTPVLSWRNHHTLVITGSSWVHGFFILPPGSATPYRGGSIAGKTGDPMLPGITCNAWGERNDCVVQEYEAAARRVPGTSSALGFLTDVPSASAVMLITGPRASPAAVEHAMRSGGALHLPLRVRVWPTPLPASPSAEDVWDLMNAEAKLPR